MPRHADRFSISWLGDLLLADAAREQLARHGHSWPFEHLRPHLAADYLIGNQEGPITTRTAPHFPGQRWSYNADPASAAALGELGFDAVSLNNNHAFDRGPEGLRDTIGHLGAAGVTPFGAGLTLDDAAAPLLVPTPFGTVAVLGFGAWFRYGYCAGPETPGTVPVTRATVAAGRELALAAGARWVVGFVHWGKNYQPVTENQQRQAELFAAAGYDLVIGHGAHVPQPMDTLDGMPVLYSLGNSVFCTPGRFKPEFPGYGLLATTVFTADGLERIDLTCFANNNRVVRFQPKPSAPDTADAYGFSWTGHSATIELPRRVPAAVAAAAA